MSSANSQSHWPYHLLTICLKPLSLCPLPSGFDFWSIITFLLHQLSICTPLSRLGNMTTFIHNSQFYDDIQTVKQNWIGGKNPHSYAKSQFQFIIKNFKWTLNATLNTNAFISLALSCSEVTISYHILLPQISKPTLVLSFCQLLAFTSYVINKLDPPQEVAPFFHHWIYKPTYYLYLIISQIFNCWLQQECRSARIDSSFKQPKPSQEWVTLNLQHSLWSYTLPPLIPVTLDMQPIPLLSLRHLIISVFISSRLLLLQFSFLSSALSNASVLVGLPSST